MTQESDNTVDIENLENVQRLLELDPRCTLTSIAVFEVNFLTHIHNCLISSGPGTSVNFLIAPPSLVAAIKDAPRALIGAWAGRNICSFRLRDIDHLLIPNHQQPYFPNNLSTSFATGAFFARVYLQLIRDYARISAQYAVSHFLISRNFAETIASLDQFQLEKMVHDHETTIIFELTYPAENFLEIKRIFTENGPRVKEELDFARVIREKEAELRAIGEYE